MEVRYFGFSLFTESNNLTVEEFFTELEKEKYVSHMSNDNEVRTYIDTRSDDSFYKGVIVTIKDQKRFCKFTDRDSSFEITVENLKGNDKLLDFNFFIVHKVSGLGIYQHYHQSCAVNVFGQNIKTYYRKFRNAKLETELSVAENLKGDKLTEKESSTIRKKFNDRLYFAPLYKQDGIEELLKKCRSIKSFEYEYSYLTKEIKAATPLSRFVNRKVEKIVFNRETNIVEIAKGIGNFVKNMTPKRGRVHAENEHGQVLPIRIFDMPDSFGSVNYDHLVSKLDGLQVDEFSEHNFFNELTAIFSNKENEHIFGAEIASV